MQALLPALDLASVSGSAFVKTFAEGIDKEFLTLYKKVAGNNAKLMNLFPQSDAQEGPFSKMTYSGQSLIRAFSLGVKSESPRLYTTLHSEIQSGILESKKWAWKLEGLRLAGLITLAIYFPIWSLTVIILLALISGIYLIWKFNLFSKSLVKS